MWWWWKKTSPDMPGNQWDTTAAKPPFTWEEFQPHAARRVTHRRTTAVTVCGSAVMTSCKYDGNGELTHAVQRVTQWKHLTLFIHHVTDKRPSKIPEASERSPHTCVLEHANSMLFTDTMWCDVCDFGSSLPIKLKKMKTSCWPTLFSLIHLRADSTPSTVYFNALQL